MYSIFCFLVKLMYIGFDIRNKDVTVEHFFMYLNCLIQFTMALNLWFADLQHKSNCLAPEQRNLTIWSKSIIQKEILEQLFWW